MSRHVTPYRKTIGHWETTCLKLIYCASSFYITLVIVIGDFKLLSQTTLDPDCQKQLANDFNSRDLRYVQVENFLDISTANSVSDFLLSDACYKAVYGLHSIKGHATDEQTWTAAPEEDRLFFNEMLSGSGGPKFNRKMLTFMKLRDYFSSHSFCDLTSRLTGLSLPSAIPARVHLFRQGHYLRSHHDQTKNRRIAYILYLSPNWKADYGGALKLVSKDGQKTSVLPVYNSLLLFDVYSQKEHYIDPLLPAAACRARLTISAWLNGSKPN